MTATYREILAENIDATVAMMQDFYAIDGYPIDAEKSKLLFREFLDNDQLGKAWSICADEIVVGYVILTFIFSFEYGGKIAFVDELYIKDDMRGKGIGKQTIAFVQNESAARNIKMLYLEVEPHNTAAKKLYLGSGFHEHKRQLLAFVPAKT